jgi:hypothetical protein
MNISENYLQPLMPRYRAIIEPSMMIDWSKRAKAMQLMLMLIRCRACCTIRCRLEMQVLTACYLTVDALAWLRCQLAWWCCFLDLKPPLVPLSQLVRSNNGTGHWWHADMPWTWHDLAKLPLQQKCCTTIVLFGDIVSWSYLKLQGKPMSDLSHSITNCQSNHHNSYHLISSHIISYNMISSIIETCVMHHASLPWSSGHSAAAPWLSGVVEPTELRGSAWPWEPRAAGTALQWLSASSASGSSRPGGWEGLWWG